MENQIYILAGHKIPDVPIAFAAFIGKPTKEQLLNTNRFEDDELDNKLIDILLEHNVCGVRGDDDYRYEYVLVCPDEYGNLNLYDLLWTGVTDMNEKLAIQF